MVDLFEVGLHAIIEMSMKLKVWKEYTIPRKKNRHYIETDMLEDNY